MIGSTFNQMAGAQKLSPQQLQLAIQHGTIPSYIGIPLLQEKMKQEKEAQAMAAGQQKPVPIAQQIMQEAQAQHGVDSLPSGLPAEGMAGGGIIAFADGGLNEDDNYEDMVDEAEQSEMNALLDEAAANAGTPIGKSERSPEHESVSYAKPIPGGLEALAMEKNKGHGATERLIQHVMHKETGGLKDRANAVSHAGAQGVMQLMPGTAKDLGVKNSFDPEQNIEGGVKYLAQLERKYHDPKLAAMAYNWGPGNVDKWLMAGADPSKLPKETQGYIQGLAQGGSVKHFVEGGFNPETGAYETEEETPRLGLGERLYKAMGGGEGIGAGKDLPGMEKAKEAVQKLLNERNKVAPVAAEKAKAKEIIAPPIDSTEGLSQDAGLNARLDRMLATAAGPAASSAPTETPLSKIEAMFLKREANTEKQREQDKYLALLQAGLGMMGGQSPHALANIAAGGAEGVKALAASHAARTAEDNASMSGRLGLMKLGNQAEQNKYLQQYRDAALKANLGEKEAARLGAKDTKTLQLLSGIEDKARASVSKDIAASPVLQSKPDIEAIREKMVQDRLRAHGTYGQKYKEYHGESPWDDIAAPMTADRSSQFGVIRP